MLLACHDTLICKEISIDLLTEIVACQLMLANKPSLIICSVYRPPDRDVENIENLCKAFESLCLTHPDIPIWIAGDLNLPNMDWENYCIVDNAYPVAICECLIDFMQEYGFSQTVSFPTRKNNILDIFITNRPSLITFCSTIPGISDHEAVCIKSAIQATV